MILIPQRLFELKSVRTIFRDGNVCILEKELSKSIHDREGYISNHVISIQLSGEQHIRTYEDDLIKVKTNEVVFIPRGLYHVTDLIARDGIFKNLLFYFDDAIILDFLATSKITSISKKDVQAYLKFGVIPSIELFAKSLIQIYQGNKLKNKRFLNLKILELLHLLNGLASEQQFANFLFRLTLPQKRNIKSFMEHNFDKPLKIEDYAYLTGRSVSTFRRDFKFSFEITPRKWIKEKRLDKAVELLKKKEISVTQLAYDVGYENISYFIKEFKNHTGLSPKQFLLARNRNNLQN